MVWEGDACGRRVGPGLYPEGRKSQGKTQGELRTAAEITKQRRKRQTGTTENSWKEMMCTLYHTMIISTA